VGFLGVVTSQKAAKKRQKDILGNTDVAMGVLSTSMTYRTFVIKASYFLIFLSFEDRLIPIFEFIKD